MPDSILIVIPTYNEKENLSTLVSQLRQSVPEAHLLIVDDGSPDGTGTMADGFAARDPQVHVLHRTTKDGLGRAYVAGFSWGLSHGYSRLVQMDADLSHSPADVPRLLAADADLVIGSRYVTGGGTVNWGLSRRILSRGGCLYARTILGLSLQDLTGGFKCWRRPALEAVNLPEIRSNGYSFQIEMTWRALQAGFRATEVPIVFTDRVDGVSKMSKRIVFEAVGMVWRLRLSRPTTRQS
ncbi:MAG: polyprenol monophosphomannose synthase [Armatimonadetes bacterium]|jgi:dolichol-phosphate mannosyltransferase|nr:polyprenol monophosphomannose synthase [Armatimonadota bacterium]